MALPLVQKNWGLFYFNSKLNFRHPPRSDKVDFWPIYRIALVDISAARTHDEWVNTDEHKRCTLLVVGGVEVGRGGCGVGNRREEAPFRSPGSEEPLSIFRIFAVKFRKRYQSHFEAPGLHLFVRDAEHCSDDCANSSNPTYSRSSHTQAQTHTHTLRRRTQLSICLFPEQQCVQRW